MTFNSSAILSNHKNCINVGWFLLSTILGIWIHSTHSLPKIDLSLVIYIWIYSINYSYQYCKLSQEYL